MMIECEAAIASEQRGRLDEERHPDGPLPLELAQEAPAPDQVQPRGRPWAKGQSGNPAGRPARIHPPAAVAEYVLARKTIPLAKKLRDLALAGDRSMLRLWFQHVAPSR